jgi:hypothetical protein
MHNLHIAGLSRAAMTENSRPVDLLHAHHLSRQIGHVHERVKTLEGFRQDAAVQLKTLDSIPKQDHSANVLRLLDEAKMCDKELVSRTQAIENELKKLTQAIHTLKDQNESLQDGMRKLSSKNASTEKFTYSDSSLLMRVLAIEEAQKSTDQQFDDIRKSLLRSEQGNDSLKELMTDLLQSIQSNKFQIPTTPPNDFHKLTPLLPTSPTDSVVRSSPPLGRIMSSHRFKLKAIRQSRQRYPGRQSKIPQSENLPSLSTPTAMIRNGSRQAGNLEKPINQMLTLKPGIMTGFTIIGEPHLVTHDRDRRISNNHKKKSKR